MESIFSKITIFSVCTFISSCLLSEGGREKVLAEINEHYYVLVGTPYPDEADVGGVMIGYSPKGGTGGGFTIEAFNCSDIYYNKDTIIYSKPFKGSDTLSYYIIPINPKRGDGLTNDPIQIKEGFFQSNIGRFKKVNIPDEKK